MNEYTLTEFTSKKKIINVSSSESVLYDVLLEIYQNNLEVMFDAKGNSKGFISIFVNAQQLFSILNVTLKNHDEIHIITSISGG